MSSRSLDLSASLIFCRNAVKGRSLPLAQLVYNLRIPRERPIIGGFFFMKPVNQKLIERTFGLLEMQARQGMFKNPCLLCNPIHNNKLMCDPSTLAAELRHHSSSELTKIAQRERYGSNFAYDEFLVTGSRLSAFLLTTAFAVAFGLIAFVKPVRSHALSSSVTQ